jgi:NAD(P)-dependent dehydrogenase (short-subunit alcohol dehydrogenase family)
MPIAIAGKRVILTGGARGIGAAAVRHFVKEGARVVALDVLEAGKTVAAEATVGGPGNASFLRVDLTQRAAIRDAVDAAVAELGGVDALLNIAGIERTVAAEAIGEAAWLEMLGVNVVALTAMCETVFPHMKAGGGGSIVNLASDAGLQPYAGGAHYAASKGAVLAYTRTLAVEWGPHGIRANCVLPAALTPMFEEKRARMTPEECAAMDIRLAKGFPLTGKFGDPEGDIAPVLAFLVSDASRYMSAQNLGVSGAAAWGR